MHCWKQFDSGVPENREGATDEKEKEKKEKRVRKGRRYLQAS